ncbi:MAG: YraN family protein [Clostridiales bacterium]|jgi:putative endonuclease|nr:YraN family protein [Clostridiales bacterium]
MSRYKKNIGDYGEIIAQKYLCNKNFFIIAKNFRNRFGEIDIIAYDNLLKEIVFIEVKTRKSIFFGYPCESINIKKQNKIKNTALDFISRNYFENINFRFDVIEIILNNNLEINHIKDAFIFD